MKATQESNELLLQALAHDEYRRQPGGSRGRLMPASNRQVRAKDIATHDQRLACKGW